MHLARLLLEKYKAFQLPCDIEIRPLTIFVGANSSGKSALVRALPLLAGGLSRPDLATVEQPLPLRSFGLTHGNLFEDLIAGRAVHGSIGLTVCFQPTDQVESLAVVLQNVVSPGRKTRQVVTQWTLRLPKGRQVALQRPSLDSDTYQAVITTDGRDVELQGDVSWSGLVPRSEQIRLGAGERQRLDEATASLRDWARGVRYLCSPRELIESPFHTPDSPPAALGVTGSAAPLMLATSERLLREVRRWFMAVFGVRLNVRQQGDTSVVEMLEPAGRPSIAIAQAGQGLSQVLPVAIQCFTAKEAGRGVDIVEHPEAELHPRAHTGIADLIVEHLPGAARPVLVETHSEVLLLRVRRHVAEGRLSPDDVAVYWIDRDSEAGSATVRSITISADGEVTGWPDGVFLEDYEEVIAIRRAARHRRGE